jgi:hypothetical protein
MKITWLIMKVSKLWMIKFQSSYFFPGRPIQIHLHIDLKVNHVQKSYVTSMYLIYQSFIIELSVDTTRKHPTYVFAKVPQLLSNLKLGITAEEGQELN